jgi:hypothetical protein
MNLPAFLMMLATCPVSLATGESVQVEKLNFERHLLGRYTMGLASSATVRSGDAGA